MTENLRRQGDKIRAQFSSGRYRKFRMNATRIKSFLPDRSPGTGTSFPQPLFPLPRYTAARNRRRHGVRRLGTLENDSRLAHSAATASCSMGISRSAIVPANASKEESSSRRDANREVAKPIFMGQPDSAIRLASAILARTRSARESGPGRRASARNRTAYRSPWCR